MLGWRPQSREGAIVATAKGRMTFGVVAAKMGSGSFAEVTAHR